MSKISNQSNRIRNNFERIFFIWNDKKQFNSKNYFPFYDYFEINSIPLLFHFKSKTENIF